MRMISKMSDQPNFKQMSNNEIIAYVRDRPEKEQIDLLYRHPDIKDRLTFPECADFFGGRKKGFPPKRNKTKGYVYLITDGTFFKIGQSITPKKRLAAMRTTSPSELVLLHVIATDDMDTLETRLHSKFSKKNIRGEWFRLTDGDVKYITSL